MAATRPSSEDKTQVDFLYKVIQGVKESYKDPSFKEAVKTFEKTARNIKDSALPDNEKAKRLFQLIHDTFQQKQAADRHLANEGGKKPKRALFTGLFTSRGSAGRETQAGYQRSLNENSGKHHYARLLSSALNIAATRCPDLVTVAHNDMLKLAQGIEMNPSYGRQVRQYGEARKAADPNGYGAFHEKLTQAGVREIYISNLYDGKMKLDAANLPYVFPDASDYVTTSSGKRDLLNGKPFDPSDAEIKVATNYRAQREGEELINAMMSPGVKVASSSSISANMQVGQERTMLNKAFAAVDAIKERQVVLNRVADEKEEHHFKPTA